MSANQLERRALQRFDFSLPVSIFLPSTGGRGSGFSQNLSARGVLLCTDFPLSAGDCVELTLNLPSEITLAENMRVRCLGTVVREARSSKAGVAVRLEKYEFLPEREAEEIPGAFERISALHHQTTGETEVTANSQDPTSP